MKKSILFKPNAAIFFIVLLTIGAGSCCTKKYCLGADDMNYIQFNNFTNSELDTIIIQRFSRNSNFVSVIESTSVINNDLPTGSNFQQIRLPIRLTTDFDYKIQLKSIGEDFTISEFVTKKEECNTGFMCIDSYNSLVSYHINGKLKSTYQLEINK